MAINAKPAPKQELEFAGDLSADAEVLLVLLARGREWRSRAKLAIAGFRPAKLRAAARELVQEMLKLMRD
jgi:hypothetical protein